MCFLFLLQLPLGFRERKMRTDEEEKKDEHFEGKKRIQMNRCSKRRFELSHLVSSSLSERMTDEDEEDGEWKKRVSK